MASAAKPLRVLCLHGFLQNGEVFKSKTGSLRKSVKKLAEFEYVTAPLVVPRDLFMQDEILASNSTQFDEKDPEALRTWWLLNADRTVYTEFDVSMRYLEEIFRTKGPFDGVLGFSQGAAMTGILCSLVGNEKYDWLQFRFAIVISGFKSLDAAFAHYYESPIKVPTLHVIGDGDERVVPSRSDGLKECFVDPDVYRHPGGHFVPGDAAMKAACYTFLAKQQLASA